MDLICLVNIN